MTTPEGLTREEREQYWRERRLAMFEGDPEMQAVIRAAKFDYESTPEEDEEDIRISRERAATGKTISLDEFYRRQAEEFPEEARYTIPERWWNTQSD